MELKIVYIYTLESVETIEKHDQLVANKIKELNPKFYTIHTVADAIIWRTKITIMEPY